MAFVTIPGGGVTSAQGFQAAGVAAGIKKNGNPDMALIVSEVTASAAAVFTTNLVQAAPVVVSREHVQGGKARAVIVNAGNANACTGDQGLADARTMARRTAEMLGLADEKEVLVCSTGVIGVQLPMDRVEAGIGMAAAALSRQGGDAAAKAIMTTDTVDKQAAVRFTLRGKTVTIGGMCKGAGMIHPNMATMLAFLTTDCAIEAALLQKALREATEKSFNMISIDGDTSTNDTLLVLANGLAGNPVIAAEDEDYRLFQKALEAVCITLAKAIAADGEGATKLLEVRVEGAPGDGEARKIVKAILNSPLVKTAFYGEDANWGRILAAAGYSGARFDPAKVDVWLGDEMVCRQGGGLAFSEERAAKILAEREILVTLRLNQGEGTAVGWGCDLSHDYVTINGDYRT